MNDVKVLSVRSVSDLVTKGTTPTSIGHRFTANGVRFLKVETFGETGAYIPGREAFISEATHQALQRSQLAEGDVLFSIAGVLGRSTMVEADWLPANTNQAFAIIRPSRQNCEIRSRFLLWVLRSPAIAKRIAEINVQAAQANLSLEQVRDFEIPVPPMEEQARIEGILDDADALVTSLERLIAKKRDVKQGMMHELLTSRIRLPCFTGEWREVTFGDVVRIQRGTMLTRAQAGHGEVPVIAGGKTPAGFTDRPNRTGRTITVSASGASAGYVSLHNGPIFASDCSTIGMANSYDLDFIYFSLVLRQDDIYKSQTGGAQPHVHARDIYPMELLIPSSIEEQRAIGRVLSEANAEIESLERRLESARAVKVGLMQELLTGRTRLPATEEA